MPFLTDKVLEGDFVRLRHVRVEDAEAILAAKQKSDRVSSTWRHHLPGTLEEEREVLRRHIQDEDRWQYLMSRKEDGEIIGVIGLETNTKKDQSGKQRYGLDNHRVARLGMLLFREDPWDHHCEKEAIRLLLAATFRQELRSKNGERFKICDVNIRVNVDDEVTVGVLVSLGFKYTNIFLEYHDRETVILEYFPTDLNPDEC